MDREAAQFLRALRGRRSQVAWARRLGYRGNPSTNWERAKRFPTAREALRAAELAQHDVCAAFRAFSPAVPLVVADGEYQLAAWLESLRGGTRTSEVALRAGRSRFSVRRWLQGEAEPRLPDFFRLVDALTGRLPDWVAAFVPIDRVPRLAARHARVLAAKRIAFEAPWSEAILRLLETVRFRQLERHDLQSIVEHSGIGLEEVERCMALLMSSGIVSRQRGKYAVNGAASVDTHGGRAALHRLKGHWAEVARGRLQSEPLDSDLFAYNVMSLAERDVERIREILHAAFKEIRTLVSVSEPEETVVLLNLHLVNLFQLRRA